ncbi:hypothetical protein ACQPZX_28100 [Actinoplanes sp. CA-142083]|uniref:hypothetical protein n=1 Tax=Actinoplanes sp. CA-142083 TaxID=3239903 RepID=UPI003D940B49
MSSNPPHVRRLALLAYQLLWPDAYPPEAGDARWDAVHEHVERLFADLGNGGRRGLQTVSKDTDDPAAKNPPRMRLAVLRALAGRLGLDPRDNTDETTLAAAIRDAIDRDLAQDRKDDAMPESKFADITIDMRNLPDTFDPDAYLTGIEKLFNARDIPLTTPTAKAHAAYVTGALLRDSYYDTKSPGFEDAFVEQFNEGYIRPDTVGSGKLPKVDTPAADLRRIEVYLSVFRLINDFNGAQKPSVQEVAFVSDEVIDRGPVNDNTTAKARSAFDDFVGLTPQYDTLDLPPLITEDNTQGAYEPSNIRACAMIGAANHLDRAGLMLAVDQAAQDWSDGVLPVGDPAGRLFDPYVWGARDRLDPAARQIQYDRISELDDYLLRFCSAVSERERGFYLSEYLTGGPQNRRSVQPQDAAVRKTARDLLAYASMHGWAYTAFAARRIGNHIRTCVEIIENAEVQKAYGVTAPWQVVERINTMTSGSTPNLAKELTLSSTGKEVMDLLAAKAKDIAANRAGIPLFPPPDTGVINVNGGGPASVFSASEYQTLLVHVENWLAASAITDTQRYDAAQPREAPAAPSLPQLGGFTAPDPNAIRDQLMQMVNSGQTPSADQVQQLLGR